MELKEVGRIIRERRKVLGITQPMLAELAEVNINSVLRLEKGTGNPSLEVLNRITKTLGMELRLDVKRRV